MSTPFETSRKSGKHKELANLVGEWEGTTRVWFEPGKLADESPCKGSIKSILDGRFVLHEYAGSMDGKPLEGMAIIGYHLGNETYQVAWLDSFHMGTGIMLSEGKEKNLNVMGHYGAGDETWGWRTEVELTGENELIITAYNVTPSGEEAKAVETIYKRTFHEH